MVPVVSVIKHTVHITTYGESNLCDKDLCTHCRPMVPVVSKIKLSVSIADL